MDAGLQPRIASSSLKNLHVLQPLPVPLLWSLIDLYSPFRFLIFALHCFQSLLYPFSSIFFAISSNIGLILDAPSSSCWILSSPQRCMRSQTSSSETKVFCDWLLFCDSLFFFLITQKPFSYHLAFTRPTYAPKPHWSWLQTTSRKWFTNRFTTWLLNRFSAFTPGVSKPVQQKPAWEPA